MTTTEITKPGVTPLVRVFNFGSARLADFDPSMTPLEVKTFYSAAYAELTTYDIEGPNIVGDKIEYTFRKAVKDKG